MEENETKDNAEDVKSTNKISISRFFNFDDNDIAVAFHKVVTRLYGTDSMSGWSFYSKKTRDLSMITVKTGCSEEAYGVSGDVRIRTKNLTLYFNLDYPSISCTFDKKFQPEVEKFFLELITQLDNESIYKGKAITIFREFLDLNRIDFDKLVFNEDILRELQIHIWTLIEKRAACKEMNIGFQRKILLKGPYGSGKTLAAYLTAKKATDNGITFIYLPPTTIWSSSSIKFLFEFARKYQPCIGFLEDIDHEQRAKDDFTFRDILSQLDGLMTKGTDVMLVTTTNFSDRIEGGLQRPGRIDKIIQMGGMSAKDIRNLIISTVSDKFLDAGIDWDLIGKECKNFPPAFVVEVATSSALTAVFDGSGLVRTNMLVKVARDLKSQIDACNRSLQVGFVVEQKLANSKPKFQNGHDEEEAEEDTRYSDI